LVGRNDYYPPHPSSILASDMFNSIMVLSLVVDWLEGKYWGFPRALQPGKKIKKS
jgi:hypothetical protein